MDEKYYYAILGLSFDRLNKLSGELRCCCGLWVDLVRLSYERDVNWIYLT